MKLLRSTAGGKTGTIDGLNIFFGGLLGANLGSLAKMPMTDYLQLVVLLAGSVITLRMISTSEQRRKMVSSVLLYVILIGGIGFVPAFQPKGMDVGDLHRIVATLGVWLGAVLMTELMPIAQAEPEGALGPERP